MEQKIENEIELVEILGFKELKFTYHNKGIWVVPRIRVPPW